MEEQEPLLVSIHSKAKNCMRKEEQLYSNKLRTQELKEVSTREMATKLPRIATKASTLMFTKDDAI